MRTIKILIKTETQINNHQDSTTRPRITRITGKITIKSNKFLSPAPMCLSQWVATREDTTMGIKMDTITRMVMDSVHTTVSDYFFYIFNGLIILFWLIFFYILLCFFTDTRNGNQQYRNNNSNGNKSGGSGSSFGSPPPHFATPPHFPQMHPHHQDMLGKY